MNICSVVDYFCCNSKKRTSFRIHVHVSTNSSYVVVSEYAVGISMILRLWLTAALEALAFWGQTLPPSLRIKWHPAGTWCLSNGSLGCRWIREAWGTIRHQATLSSSLNHKPHVLKPRCFFKLSYFTGVIIQTCIACVMSNTPGSLATAWMRVARRNRLYQPSLPQTVSRRQELFFQRCSGPV